eukprot:gene1264-32612_t
MSFCVGLWALVSDDPVAFDPEREMYEVVKYTHYMPRHWRGRAHTSEVQAAFNALFKPKVLLFFEEMASVILTPFMLYFSLPACAEEIAEFLRESTVHIDGVGDVCCLANFDLDQHGSTKYGAPGQPTCYPHHPHQKGGGAPRGGPPDSSGVVCNRQGKDRYTPFYSPIFSLSQTNYHRHYMGDSGDVPPYYFPGQGPDPMDPSYALPRYREGLNPRQYSLSPQNGLSPWPGQYEGTPPAMQAGQHCGPGPVGERPQPVPPVDEASPSASYHRLDGRRAVQVVVPESTRGTVDGVEPSHMPGGMVLNGFGSSLQHSGHHGDLDPFREGQPGQHRNHPGTTGGTRSDQQPDGTDRMGSTGPAYNDYEESPPGCREETCGHGSSADADLNVHGYKGGTTDVIDVHGYEGRTTNEMDLQLPFSTPPDDYQCHGQRAGTQSLGFTPDPLGSDSGTTPNLVFPHNAKYNPSRPTTSTAQSELLVPKPWRPQVSRLRGQPIHSGPGSSTASVSYSDVQRTPGTSSSLSAPEPSHRQTNPGVPPSHGHSGSYQWTPQGPGPANLQYGLRPPPPCVPQSGGLGPPLANYSRGGSERVQSSGAASGYHASVMAHGLNDFGARGGSEGVQGSGASSGYHASSMAHGLNDFGARGGDDSLPRNETEDLQNRLVAGHGLLQSLYEAREVTVQHRRMQALAERSISHSRLGRKSDLGGHGQP